MFGQDTVHSQPLGSGSVSKPNKPDNCSIDKFCSGSCPIRINPPTHRIQVNVGANWEF